MNNHMNGNYYEAPTQYQPTPAQTNVKKASKKNSVIIIIVVIAVLAGAIGFGASFFLKNNQQQGDIPTRIVTLLKNKEFSEALELYEKMYGNGKSDEKLELALGNRIIDIKAEYINGTITKKIALKELETIEKMNISVLEKDIRKVRNYIESSTSNTNNNSDSPVETTAKTPVQEETTKPIEEIPDDNISHTPHISEATTLNGIVLQSSNEDSSRSFGADRTIDKNFESCWCVNTESTGGAGASIEFTLTEKSYVKGIRIINGNNFHPEEDIYRSNGQLKSFTLTFSDGTKMTFTANYNSTASNVYQYFDFDTPIVTDSIILTVNSGYAGVKYTTNVCLGEFDVY